MPYVIIQHILLIVGSIVLFLFGMKLMSEALQKVSGLWLRNIINRITTNRFSGLFSGFILTSIIQSSSATTVLVVGFVHAGLLNLAQSISVILGANIGTTITAWMISLIGFKFNISIIALPLLTVFFPLIFSKNSNKRSWGEVIVGFAILFIGLGFLKQYLPDINRDLNLIEFINNYSQYGYYSILIFTGIGILLTIIVQSSSATIALTFVMCSNGWISFELAAAMILGENIGTTVTANIAAIVANKQAKRAALSHFLVNFVGVVLALCVFKPFLNLVEIIVLKLGIVSTKYKYSSIPITLSLFHTLFNLMLALVFVNFIPLIEKVTKVFIKGTKSDIDDNKLKLFQTGMLSTSELTLVKVRKELYLYAQIAGDMFKQLHKLLYINDEHKFKKEYNEIKFTEERMDILERYIADYLTKIGERDLSILASKEVRAYLKISDNIESIADACYNISKALRRKQKKKIWFTPQQRQKIDDLFTMVDKVLELMIKQLETLNFGDNKTEIAYIEMHINKFSNTASCLIKDVTNKIKSKDYTYQSGVVFTDIVALSETLCSHVLNISQALQFSTPEE